MIGNHIKIRPKRDLLRLRLADDAIAPIGAPEPPEGGAAVTLLTIHPTNKYTIHLLTCHVHGGCIGDETIAGCFKRTFESIFLLTGPHQISLLDPSSSTMRLSEGERPVLAPEYAERAPEAVMAEPVS